MAIKKILSGGQTGVDRAAQDAAIEFEIPHGGWCPKGRLAELGTTIPEKYSLQETASGDFSERTKLNIRDSDGTLILVPKTPIAVTDGTILTIEETQKTGKPYLIIDLSKEPSIEQITKWLEQHDIKILNIAGPRESQSPGVYTASLQFLKKIFSTLNLQSSVTETDAEVASTTNTNGTIQQQSESGFIPTPH